MQQPRQKMQQYQTTKQPETDQPPTTASQAPNSKRYLNHFESINRSARIPSNFMTSSTGTNAKNKFNQALESYAEYGSKIDEIASLSVREYQGYVHSEEDFEDFVNVPMILNLGNKIKERVSAINMFFHVSNQDNLFQNNHENDDGTLNGYIQNILNIDVNNILFIPQMNEFRQRSNSKSRSKSSNKFKPQPPIHQAQSPTITQPPMTKQQVEVNTDPIQGQNAPVLGAPKLKKMDLILVQIMREKKRKGLVSDYFRAIQMKLVELLQYILHDQPDYFGLNLVDKMKEVLKNLEKFKGKTIDGESKVNMLRIFFQEFRNLKKQRQQEGQSRQNRSRSNSKKTGSRNQKQANQKEKQANSVLITHTNHMQNNQNAHKNKKSFDTFSVGGNRSNKNPPKNPSTKSVKEEDQWIGSLDN